VLALSLARYEEIIAKPRTNRYERVSLQLRSCRPKSKPDQMQKCQVAHDVYIYIYIYVYLALGIPEGRLIPFLPDWSFYFRLHIIISLHVLPWKPGRMLIRGELKKKLAVGINPDVKKNTRNGVEISNTRRARLKRNMRCHFERSLVGEIIRPASFPSFPSCRLFPRVISRTELNAAENRGPSFRGDEDRVSRESTD